ncbi:MAG: A/G-specific adenine glycosylase [Bacteroidetes bacterium]|nr:A/G-specific adenine glycosylase [Bacteroidota bacterium]
MEELQKTFTRLLMQWNKQTNKRDMPWKGEKDPYKIWLSEIILQQTRVEQGWSYYNNFIEAFPTVHQLAAAPEDKVFKLWEGLGYYTRCKNLITTAKYISKELKGVFPINYDSILQLKGIGPYTAAAIASFAYNLPYAVVDGNVFRVLARYFDNDTPTDSNEGKKLFTEMANALLDKKNPGIYNQALMDFGAVVCKPRQPLCANCPLQKNCCGFANDKVDVLPVKEKKIVPKVRWLYYLIVERAGKTLIRKRTQKDIWENLYEFVLLEHTGAVTIDELQQLPAFKKMFGNTGFSINTISPLYNQKLTHQQLYGQFISITPAKKMLIDGYEEVDRKSLAALPFPKFITSYLKDKNVSLNLL